MAGQAPNFLCDLAAFSLPHGLEVLTGCQSFCRNAVAEQLYRVFLGIDAGAIVRVGDSALACPDVRQLVGKGEDLGPFRITSIYEH